MKKRIIFILGMMLLVTILIILPGTNAYAAVEPKIQNLTVNAVLSSEQVGVEGNISSGSGKNITLECFNPEGDLDYIGQTISTEDSKFTFTFILKDAVDGDYTVKVGGEGISQPCETTFIFSKTIPAEPSSHSSSGSSSTWVPGAPTVTVMAPSSSDIAEAKEITPKGGSSVSKDKVWTIRFNKELDRSTVLATNVVVLDSNGKVVIVNISMGSDGKSIVVTPISVTNYVSGQTYTLFISKNIKSSDKGENLSDFYVVKYTISK